MTGRTPLSDVNDCTSITRHSVSPWIEEVERGCEQVDVWDTVLPVAHHRGEADVVEEVCGRTVTHHPKPVINSPVHHRQQSLHKQPQKQRAGALMLPSSCLVGSITRVGPGHHPQNTCALHGGEAVGGSSQQHSTSQNEPKLRHGSLG